MKPFEVGKIDETVNQRVARYRKAVGYSQHMMAEFLGQKHSTYSQKERMGNIDCDTLIKIAYILGIDIKILLYGEKEGEEVNNKPNFVVSEQEKRLIEAIRFLKSKHRDLVYELVAAMLKIK